MKKHLILFLLTTLTVLGSCSKDDEEPENNEDPIIGTWFLVEADENAVIDPEACEEQSTITFFENSTASAIFYLSGTDCQAQVSGGTWSNTEGSTYNLSVPFMGSQDIDVDFDDSQRFSFEYHDVTLTFESQ